MLRRITVSLTVLGLAAVALVGCASSTDSAAGCTPAPTSPALDLVSTSGDLGSPVATLTDPVYVENTAAEIVTAGEGPVVTSDAQDVQFVVTFVSGATGQTLLSGARTEVSRLSGFADHYAGLTDMLLCASEGSRVVGAIPASEFSEEAASSMGVTANQSVVAIVDLQRVYPAAADGAPQYNDRQGMPSVVLAPDGTPGVIIPDAVPPSDLAVEVLKKGDGPAVGADDTIRVQYTGVTWADRTVFDSTWENGASAAVTLDAVVPGFAQALDGQTVGSQILVVIPPSLGYGDTAQGSIPANSTLVFVIDILGTDTVTATTQ